MRNYSVTPMGVLNEATKTGVTYLYGYHKSIVICLSCLFILSCDYGKTSGNHVISVVNKHICSELDAKKYKHLYLTFDNCAVNQNYMMVGYVLAVLSVLRLIH